MTGAPAGAGQGRFPDFIIIGAAKSATSTLHEQLAAQPGIFMSQPKEPCFFSDDDVYAKGVAWYQALYAHARPSDITGESSTHYTKLPTYPHTIERLAAAYPEGPPPLIYMMRHPVDRMLSQYVHMWTEAELDCTPDDAIERYPELVSYSCYHRQIEPYAERWGIDSVLPVFFDRLKTRQDAELRRVADFIGHEGPVRWDDSVSAVNVSSQRLRVSPWRDRIVEAPILSTIRRRVIPKRIRDRVKAVWQFDGRPELSAESRRRVEAIFDEDLEKLGALLGQHLSCATFSDITRDESLEWGARHGVDH